MTLFIANSAQEKTAIVGYSNTQWRYGTFWVEGITPPSCGTVSFVGNVFVQATDNCTNVNYFHCEYSSESTFSTLKDLLMNSVS